MLLDRHIKPIHWTTMVNRQFVRDYNRACEDSQHPINPRRKSECSTIRNWKERRTLLPGVMALVLVFSCVLMTPFLSSVKREKWTMEHSYTWRLSNAVHLHLLVPHAPHSATVALFRLACSTRLRLTVILVLAIFYMKCFSKASFNIYFWPAESSLAHHSCHSHLGLGEISNSNGFLSRLAMLLALHWESDAFLLRRNAFSPNGGRF